MEPYIGLNVSIDRLESIKGMVIHKKHLQCRRLNEVVEIVGYVPGHGGDVWFCRHLNKDIGAYSLTEMIEVRQTKKDRIMKTINELIEEPIKLIVSVLELKCKTSERKQLFEQKGVGK